jgi:signal-transduction protein with cAMP-binding, CBS, and nucleotidyltransferase domain
MALILGSDGDILNSRVMQELVSELDRMIADQTAYLMPEQHSSLISGIARELQGERDWEEASFLEIRRLLAHLELAPDMTALQDRYRLFRQNAEAYFERRESVLAMHHLCGMVRDSVLNWAVKSVLAARGRCPVPFTVGALGNYGRGESTFSSSCDLLLVYENVDLSGERWFAGFADEVSRLLERIGLVAGFMRIDDPEWRGSQELWRERVAAQAGTPDPASETVSLCDLRPVYGDPELIIELRRTAHDTLVGSPLAFQSALRSASIMPVGFNFFGKLKVEKSGSHRGEFNLVQFALNPMVVTLRMLAIQQNIVERSTPDRIRRLQQLGELGVDQAARLLHTYQDFLRIKLTAEVASKGNEQKGFYLDREDISHFDEACLKQGLDALFNLQRIVYQNVES